jgi:drug/metabolite transporter (DMT)-like permease
MHLLLLIILFSLFASIFSLQKIGLNYSAPYFFIGFRMIFAGMILLFFYSFLNRKFFLPMKKDIKNIIYLTIFNIFLTNSFEIIGLNNTSSSKACMIYSISPFITYIMAFFILKEKITYKKTLGLFIGISGLIPIIFSKTTEEIKIIKFMFLSSAEISLLISVFFSILGWIYLKKLIKIGYSYIYLNGISMFFGGICIILLSLKFENWKPIPINNFNSFVFYIIVTTIISNIICYNLFGYLLKYFSTTFMTFSGLMTPFFASIFGYIFLNEIIPINYLLSMILFLLGLLIFYYNDV